MAWYLDTTRIFVNEHVEDAAQIIPRLQPLSGGTVQQIFGYESPILGITALVIGSGDSRILRDKTTDGILHTLSGPEGIMGDYLVRKASLARIHSVCQTIRPDLPTDAEVYEVKLELYEGT